MNEEQRKAALAEAMIILDNEDHLGWEVMIRKLLERIS